MSTLKLIIKLSYNGTAMKNFNILTGTRILEEVDSPVNGKVRVVQSVGWGTSVQAGDLTQSGGVVHGVWKHSLKKVSSIKNQVSNCLILGLGGGSCAKLVRKHWPDSKIVGIELDPVMVDLGMKYLGLSQADVDIKITDAFEYCEKALKKGNKHDLVLVDMYVGQEVPLQVEKEDFIKTTQNLMEDSAISVFNRLYFGEKRGLAESFRKKLEKYYASVTPVYPEANVMYVCSNKE